METKKSNEKRTRNWWFVLYPDSAPNNWKTILNDLHIQYYVSPLHDKDINPDGEMKKAHWHVIVTFEGVKSYSQIKEITDSLNAPIPQSVQSLTGTVRYLIHKDNPEKHQYNAVDIICGGGADASEYLQTNADKDAMLDEIFDYIEDNDITEFYDLMRYARYHNSEWYKFLMHGFTISFKEIIRSRRHSPALQKERTEYANIEVNETTGEVIE